MPFYDFYCNKCDQKSSLFMKIKDYNGDPACPVCGKYGMTRIISGVAIHNPYSPGSIGESDPDYYKDPRNIGRSMEKRFRDMNIEMPSEVKKSLEQAREGVLPDSLKDLGNASPDSSYH
jgi:putative FmdB family regulatory protein